MVIAPSRSGRLASEERWPAMKEERQVNRNDEPV